MSKNRLLRLIALIALSAAFLLTGLRPTLAASNSAVILRLEGPLNPVWESYIARGLGVAKANNAAVVIIELNTPGGSIDLMNKLVQQIRGSSIPIVVYVSPNGAMAGSAGTILTLAGHANAMAPETAIGAASPVDAQGQDIGSTMQSKLKEILKATARSLAERRSPAALSLVDDMIDQAKAVSASEALAVGLIDVKASNVSDLLQQLDGRTVYLGSQAVVLHTAGLEQVQVPISAIELFLQILVDPNLVFILLAVGVQALLIELSNPGAWIPGFIAAVCLTLAVYGLGILPVNWFGIIFVLLAFVLFFLDIKTPTHGALTVAGVVSFIIGALVLFNSPSVPAFQRVSVPLVIGTGVFIGLIFFTIVIFALRAQRRPVLNGSAGLIGLAGQIGFTRGELAPSGPVQLGSELWSATLEDLSARVPKDTKVEVLRVEGLHLRVRKVKE